jgi:hypothetical protein
MSSTTTRGRLSTHKGGSTKTCIACSTDILRGEGVKDPREFWLCESCEPRANTICTSESCNCLDEPSDIDECVCFVNGLGESCDVCLSPMVFIDVSTGETLRLTS